MKQLTALRNAAKIAERLHSWGGVVDTPRSYWSQVKFHGLWLFGSTAQGKKEPGDVDIMYSMDTRHGDQTGLYYPENELGDYRALVELRRGIQRIRYHDLCNDAFALDHGAIELYPNNRLDIQAILNKEYVPVRRINLDTDKARRNSDDAVGRWCPTQT